VVGAATALFAGVVSATQSDIKKILAYSTISQIGFMIMMCGVGAFAAAVFHLLAHGLLKAFLFLSTGDALRALTPHRRHETGDSAGARSGAVLAGTLLFACLPPVLLFSGSYATMWTAAGFPQAVAAFWIVALATVFLTAAYLARAADVRFRHGFPHAGSVVGPRFWSIPHVFIAAASALVLMAFLFAFPARFLGFIAPALARVDGSSSAAAPSMPVVWLILPLVAAVGGWVLAVVGARKTHSVTAHRPAWLKRLYVLFWNKLYFDEIYEAYFVRLHLKVARALDGHVERAVVDRALNLLALSSVGVAFWLWRVLEGRGVNRAVSGTVTASMTTARWLWKVLEGRAIQGGTDHLSHQVESIGRYLQHKELHTLQDHLLLVVSGLAALLGLFYFVIHGMG
jgi:NADH-quinone oxidoreductase subunit L